MSYGVNNPYGFCGPTGSVPFGAINWTNVNPIGNPFSYQNVLFSSATPNGNGINPTNPINACHAINAGFVAGHPYHTMNAANPNCGNINNAWVNPYGARVNPTLASVNPINASVNPNITFGNPQGVTQNVADAGATNPTCAIGATPVAYNYGYGTPYHTYNPFQPFANSGWSYVNFIPNYGPNYGYGWTPPTPFNYGWGSFTPNLPSGVNPFAAQANPSNAPYSAFTSSPFFNAASNWTAPVANASFAPQSTVAPCSYTPSGSTTETNVEAFVPATTKGGPQGTLVHPHSGSFFHVPTGTFCHRPSGTILNIPSGVAMVGTGISGGSESMAKAASFFFAHPSTQWINSTGTQWSLGEFFDYVSRS